MTVPSLLKTTMKTVTTAPAIVALGTELPGGQLRTFLRPGYPSTHRIGQFDRGHQEFQIDHVLGVQRHDPN